MDITEKIDGVLNESDDKKQLNDRKYINNLLLDLIKAKEGAKDSIRKNIIKAEDAYEKNYGYRIKYHWEKK